MDKLEEFDIINKLLEKYEAFLTASQSDIMRQYYNYNLSLGEISENNNISRTAVSDCLKKSIQKLKDCENKLHLLDKQTKIEKQVDILKKEFTLENFEKLERMIKDGI